MKKILTACFALIAFTLQAQSFYFGSDLSYANEMDDCGVIYKENNTPKDVYQIFADHGTNIVRLRLWHTPSWYDSLNTGKRYSDYIDVCHSILRAKAAGMSVLLDFHLSDSWADPEHQIVPAAWANVVDNLPVLQDSLYNYIYATLNDLNTKGLMPEMIQIGNETNRGILQSEQQNNAGWQLNWARNSALFKKAIQAVRDIETATNKDIKVAIHIANPSDASALIDGFWNNGVQDFDIIGLSYYWAWHKPTTIAKTGEIITQLKTKYAGKEVLILETGYTWTTQSNDNANNIISDFDPLYPPTPANQKKWLTDFTQEVINKGGLGVVYWEPAWVSSTCFTQWGQGSHQEHAVFFDFSSNMLPEGGMLWPEFNYQNLPSSTNMPNDANGSSINITSSSTQGANLIVASALGTTLVGSTLSLFDQNGRLLEHTTCNAEDRFEWSVTVKASGIYFLSLQNKEKSIVRQLWLK
jgi:arabinogalactan endo-1,4-beta-galactosidase